MPRSRSITFKPMLAGLAVVSAILLSVAVTYAQQKPKLVLVGDSTVNNSSGEFRGWGNVIGEFFDPTKIEVVNKARGGRSSRTFITEGLWDQVTPTLAEGDIVLIQFGHNDGGSIDKDRARGSLNGNDNETRKRTKRATKRTTHLTASGA